LLFARLCLSEGGGCCQSAVVGWVCVLRSVRICWRSRRTRLSCKPTQRGDDQTTPQKHNTQHQQTNKPKKTRTS
jgi:hypothetical protein